MKYKVLIILLASFSFSSYGQDNNLTLVFDKKKKTIKVPKTPFQSVLKIIVFLLTLFISNTYIYSQDVIIKYDYNSNSFKLEDKDGGKVEEISKGNKVWVTVENLNPFLYEVNAKVQSVTKNPVPANLGSFVLGDASLVNGWFQAKTTSGDPFDGTGEGTSENSEPCFDSEKVKALKQNYLDFIKELRKYNQLSFLLKKEKFKQTVIENKLNELNKKYIIEIYQDIKEEYLTITLDKKGEGCVANSTYDLLKPIFDELIKPAVEVEIQKMSELRRNINDFLEKPWVVEVFKAKNDEIKIELNITPRAEAKLFERPLNTSKVEQKYNVQSTSTISFSSGLLLTWGLNDRTYNSTSRQVNDTTAVFRILEEDEPSLGYGLNAMVNFIKNRDTDSYGLTVGFGFLPRESKLAGLAGITWLPGKKQKILISGGIGIAYRKTLSDGLSLTEELSSAPEIKRKDELSYAPWFSLAYRL